MRKLSVVISALALIVVFANPTSLTRAAETAPQPRAEKKALFRRGAKLWPMYCSQCHPARFGGEFTPPEWDLIMAHMRARANLSGDDSRALLEFLKARQ